MTVATEEQARTRTKIQDVKEGDVFSRSSYGIVVGKHFDHIEVKNVDGDIWSIANQIVENELVFAEHSDEEFNVSRTEAINLMLEHPRTAMTVVYNKKVDEGEVAEVLKEGQGELTDRQWKRKVKEATMGKMREMRGVHHRSFDAHQRLRFTEIGGEKTSGFRLVDPRTITKLVVYGKTYLVK